MDGVRLWVFGFAAAGVLTFLLHIWFAKRLTALEEVRPKWKTMGEQSKVIRTLQQKPKRLEWTAMAERVLFTVLMTVFAVGAAVPWLYHYILPEWKLPVWVNAALSLLAAFLIAFVFSLLGAIVPARACQQPEKWLAKGNGFFRMLFCCFRPLQALTASLTRRLCGKEAVSETVTEEEILSLVDEGTENGLIATEQKEMIDNILEFNDVDVSDVMTHRRKIVGVNVNMKMMDVVYLAVNENYSRMPVYQDSIDNIIGVLIVKDLLGLIGAEQVENFSIRHFMREMLFIPETAKCKDVLTEMTRHNAQMAVAVDEYGGTAGIVTVEDILEEIVGSIRDEYDEEEAEQMLRMVSENVYMIKGAADPEDILPELGLTLPEGHEFDTMSGFLVELLGRIPDAEETPVIVYQNVRFTVLLIEDNWIAKIKAERLTLSAETEMEES